MTTALYKDKHGFIWAGTGYGLNRYDGYRFKLFTREENALNGNPDISQIMEDENGRLWLFFRDGRFTIPQSYEIDALDIFDPKTELAVPFETFFSGHAPFKTSEICLPRVLDPKNRLWIHTNKGELFLYAQGRFNKIFQREGTFFQYITIDRADNIWLGWDNNLLAIDRSGKILEQLKLPHRISGLWAGADGDIWLSTRDNKYQPVSLWRKPKNSPLLPFALMHNDQAVRADPDEPFLHRDQNGYWFAKIDSRFDLFDRQGKWICNYNTLLGENPNVGFFSFFEDGNWFWAASATGILKLRVRVNPFQLIDRRENMMSDCRGITEDEHGNIYFLNSNVYQWDVHAQSRRKLPNSSGATYALLYSDSTIWAGTYGESPMGFQLDLRNGKRTDYVPFDPARFLAYTLAKTGDPKRFLVGMNLGLAYLDLEQKKLLPFDGYASGDARDSLLKRSLVNFIHKNQAGYWLATDNGIFLLDLEQGVAGHYDKAGGDLPFNHIRHIYEDKAGVFWLATKGGGVIRWQPPSPETQNARPRDAGRPYRQFTTEDGLSDNFTYAVYEDGYDKLWIPSDKGLMQMNKTSLRVRTFTTENGLLHNEFNHTAHYQAKDGTLYFGGLGGLIAFHPKAFADDGAYAAPMAFISFYVQENNADKMTDMTGVLRQSGAIRIGPDDKFFELHFAILDYDNVRQHRYAYQIEGYSDNWNYIDENFIRITHLPYGSYTLRIRGQNQSRGWSERELSLSICILRPFYLQWWFIALLAISVGGGILAAVQWRIRALKKGKERLEAEVQKRTSQLEEQNRQIESDRQIIAAQVEALKELDTAKTHFFSNITHEFRTPLTLITGPLEQMASEQTLPTMFRRRLSGVLKNAHHLLALINQLLDLSRIEGGHMKIVATQADIVAYTKDLTNRFQHLVQKKEQKLHFFTPVDQWVTAFDRDKWDKILYNLLSNAVKFTPAGQHIQISLLKVAKHRKEYIRLNVKDSGIGIEQKHLSQIFNRFYQADSTSTRTQGGTGIGLALVRELVELQGGEIRVSSEVNKGTSFDVCLPVLETPPVRAFVAEVLPEPVAQLPAREEPLNASTPNPDTRERSKLELLLIEDNEEMREYIRYCIDASRYTITEAADGEEGIQKAQALIPDLIISDVMMPKMNGFEVTKTIRSHIATSHIPLILLTAKASLESRLEGLQRGADAYLTKPFSPRELALRIQKLIEIRRLLQQRYTRDFQTQNDSPYQREDVFITGLRGFILEHLDESDLDGDRIGRHFGLSRVSLYRKINALTDQSISDFVRGIRLGKALELIREGKLNFSEIAYQTGFSSISAFSRAFKQAYGKAPSEMRSAM